MDYDGGAAQTGLFITNAGSQSLRIPAIEADLAFSNHLELIRGLLDRCHSCLLESPFLYRNFTPLVEGLDLKGKQVELISTCAVRGEDQLDKPYALRNFGHTVRTATCTWPAVHLNQALHSKIY